MKLIVLISLVLLLVACNTVKDEITGPNNDLPDSEGFYKVQSGIFQLRYKVVPTNLLECELQANTTGWLAVGFDPTSQMKNANMITGCVVSGNGQIRDDFGDTNTTHVPDTDLGGTSDVTIISASEAGGVSTIRFTIPLASGDAYDRPLAVGNTYRVIFAVGDSDDMDAYHNSLGSGNVKIR